jgi:hypothetical protein
MNSALHRGEPRDACRFGLTGALAGRSDLDATMLAESIPATHATVEPATLQPDQDGQYRSLVAGGVVGRNTRLAGAAEDPPFRPDWPVAHDGAVCTPERTAVGRDKTRAERGDSVEAGDDLGVEAIAGKGGA